MGFSGARHGVSHDESNEGREGRWSEGGRSSTARFVDSSVGGRRDSGGATEQWGPRVVGGGGPMASECGSSRGGVTGKL